MAFEFTTSRFSIYHFNINIYRPDFEGTARYYLHCYYPISRQISEWLNERSLKLIFLMFKYIYGFQKDYINEFISVYKFQIQIGTQFV